MVAALPESIVALQFIVVWWTRQPFLGADASFLTGLMKVEFLVLHGTVFLGMLGLWKPATKAAATTRAVIFWGLFSLYFALAWQEKVVLVFLGLTFVTYLGLFMNWRSPSAMVQLGARWAVGMAAFAVVLGVNGTPKDVSHWTGSNAVMRAGAMYFTLLAAVELSGLYLRRIPPHYPRIAAWLKDAWKNGRRRSS